MKRPMTICLWLLACSVALASEPVGKTWRLDGPLFLPGPPGSFDEVAVKDPSIVFAQGNWHLFYTARGRDQYSTGYACASTLEALQASPRYRLDALGGRGQYACAPQVFYFEPQGRWYLIFQTRDANYQPAFSTTTTITEPESWTAPAPLLKKDTPAKWIDFWVICDESRAYLFYTQAHNAVMVRTTSLEAFPRDWGPAREVFTGVHEGVHIYKVKGRDEYHMVYELNHGGIRSFGLATAEALAGPWQKVTDRYATGDQLAFTADVEHWTDMVSHGELLRAGFDQRLEYDPNRCQWLIQGLRESDANVPYESLPWSLGMMTGDEKR